jgi:hypothetical protein
MFTKLAPYYITNLPKTDELNSLLSAAEFATTELTQQKSIGFTPPRSTLSMAGYGAVAVQTSLSSQTLGRTTFLAGRTSPARGCKRSTRSAAICLKSQLWIKIQ